MNENQEYIDFDKVKEFVHPLGLRTPGQWIDYWEENYESILDIPRNPNIEYEDKGWKHWDDFLGEVINYIRFSECVEIVKKLGLNSITDWKIYCLSGKKSDNAPSNPHIIYSEEWKGWEYFFGIKKGSLLSSKLKEKKSNKIVVKKEVVSEDKFILFREAVEFVRKLELNSFEEWRNYCKSGKKPKNIPANPNHFYKGKGWKCWDGFLGIRKEVVNKNNKFLSFEEAREFVRNLEIKNEGEWREYCKSGKKPNNIPTSSAKMFKESGWISWPDFFGTKPGFNGNYLPFEEAREFVRNLRLNDGNEWREYCKSGKKPNNIPAGLYGMYKEKGWISWPDFLGTKPGFDRNYLPFEEARDFVRSFNFNTLSEFKSYCKSGDKPDNIPTNPNRYYSDDGWINFGDWIGNGKQIKSKKEDCLPFEEAREFIRSLEIKSQREWLKYCKSGKKPYNIPVTPNKVYKTWGWVGWNDWLGTIPYAWTNNLIVNFIKNIKKEIEILDTIEILIIIEKFGLSKKFNKNKTFSKILESESGSLKRKLNTQLLLKEYGDENADKEIEKIIDTAKEELGVNADVDIKDLELEINKDKIKLPKVGVIQSLKSFDNKCIVTYLDNENIQFLINNRVQKLWNELLNFNFKINELKKEKGGKYFTQIKNIFLNEYSDVINLEIPEGYCFEDEQGNYLEPNLMQKLTAFKVLSEKRYGNWSEAGAGKTLSAILSSRLIGAKNNLIITFNSTTDYWKETILNVFPDSIVNVKKDGVSLINGEYNYIILNYEAFQQKDSDEFVNSLIRNIEFDFIVLDEVQNVKQREKDSCSKRKGLIHKLILNCSEVNPDINLLFMSCTPIINNLIEPVTILEMLKGVSYEELNTRSNVNNALEIHKQFVINGIRFVSDKSEVLVKETFIKIDGNHLIDRLKWLPPSAILDVEKTLMNDKLVRIKDSLEPGTLIYTYYVQDIVESISYFVEQQGLSVGYYTGTEKSGLDDFKNGDIDILIGSLPISTGVDGIQKICNKLIILTLPWTGAEYENLIGRIKRQGSNFEEIEVIIPQIEINLGDKVWSWDNDRLDRIKYKRSLADTALDGKISDELLPTRQEMIKKSLKSLKEWTKRIENDDERIIERKKLVAY